MPKGVSAFIDRAAAGENDGFHMVEPGRVETPETRIGNDYALPHHRSTSPDGKTFYRSRSDGVASVVEHGLAQRYGSVVQSALRQKLVLMITVAGCGALSAFGSGICVVT